MFFFFIFLFVVVNVQGLFSSSANSFPGLARWAGREALSCS